MRRWMPLAVIVVTLIAAGRTLLAQEVIDRIAARVESDIILMRRLSGS